MRVIMFFSKRSARGLGLAVTVLAGFAASSFAQANPIKPDDVESNRQTCLASCIEQRGDAPHCTAFCNCSAKGLSDQVTQEEYDAGKLALASQQKPAQETVDKLTAIAKSCRPQLEP